MVIDIIHNKFFYSKEVVLLSHKMMVMIVLLWIHLTDIIFTMKVAATNFLPSVNWMLKKLVIISIDIRRIRVETNSTIQVTVSFQWKNSLTLWCRILLDEISIKDAF